MLSFREPPQLTAAHEKILRSQTIDKNGPGSIVRDFETLLRFVGENELAASGVLHLPPMTVVPQLNEAMANPIDVKLKRPQWKSFPNLFGLYLLLRTSGLIFIETVGLKSWLRIDEAALSNWNALDATEKYFTLLESWLRLADEEVIGERVGMITPLHKCVGFWQGQTIPRENRRVYKDALEEFRFWPGLHHLVLFEEFGLLEIERVAAQPGKGWNFKSVKLTDWGDALFALIAVKAPEVSIFHQESKNMEDWGRFVEGQENPLPWGQWQSFIAPYFPDWRQNFTLPALENNVGVCVFKVSVGKTWRRIAIASEDSLDDLSGAILNAFNFDFDHLYAFYYESRTGSRLKALHPFMDEGPDATEIKIGSLPLRVGDFMVYLYDFGDNWQFLVTLEEVRPPDAKLKNPRVLEKKGKAPEQYPDWD